MALLRDGVSAYRVAQVSGLTQPSVAKMRERVEVEDRAASLRE